MNKNYNKKVPLEDEVQKALSAELAAEKTSVVFICAAIDEYTHFLSHLDSRQIPHIPCRRLTRLKGYKYERFILDTNQGRKQCVVATPGHAGMMFSAKLCSLALGYKPELVVMPGICGGVPQKVNRGDLIVATTAFDYCAGKIEGENPLLPRFRQIDLENPNVMEAVICAENVFEQICSSCDRAAFEIEVSGQHSVVSRDSITVHRGIMGTGAAVVNSKEMIHETTRHQQDMIAYDMEAYAVAFMCKDNCPCLIVKGVQDLADTEPSQKNVYNRLAARMSASFVIESVRQFFS